MKIQTNCKFINLVLKDYFGDDYWEKEIVDDHKEDYGDGDIRHFKFYNHYINGHDDYFSMDVIYIENTSDHESITIFLSRVKNNSSTKYAPTFHGTNAFKEAKEYIDKQTE